MIERIGLWTSDVRVKQPYWARGRAPIGGKGNILGPERKSLLDIMRELDK